MIPLRTIQNAMRESGMENIAVGKEPALVMKEFIDSVIKEITIHAKKMSRTRRRATLSGKDVQMVIELKW